MADERYSCEPAAPAPDDRFHDRSWALTLVRPALARLRKEYEQNGKAQQFEQLEPCLTQAAGAGAHARCAQELGLTEGTVRVALLWLRQRFREVLRSEVAQTVSGPDEIDEELRYLLGAAGGSVLP